MWGRLTTCSGLLTRSGVCKQSRWSYGPVAGYQSRPMAMPCAGPLEIFWLGDQARAHRIHLDIACNAVELLIVSNQAILAFVLPERFPRLSEHMIGFPSSKSL